MNLFCRKKSSRGDRVLVYFATIARGCAAEGRRGLRSERHKQSKDTMKTLHRTACAAAFAAAALAASAAPEVAVLHGRNPNATDFDEAVRKVGCETDFYKCDDASIREFCAKASQYKLVLVDSLFDYGGDKKNLLSPEATDFAAVRAFVENGGVLVVADAVYQVRGWITKVDPSLALPGIGKCNSSQWAVLGHTVNREPIDPIRAFPNRITQGNDWPHFEKDVPAGWKVVADCSEGFPVTITKRLGKGLVVASALRQPGVKLLENYLAAAQLLAAGVEVKDFSLSPFALGPGRLEMSLAKPAAEGTRLVYEFTDAKDKSVSFATNFVGTAAALDYRLKVRGPVTARLWLETPDGARSLLFRRQATMPALLTVDPPAYRGILSTARRLKDVRFRVRIARLGEEIAGLPLTVSVYDSLSNCVFRHVQNFDKDWRKPIPADFEVAMPLPKELSPGGYEVRATITRNGSVVYGAKSAAPFEILAPRSAQTVVDEDNTFLVNGKPFFPLGIYHVGKDYDAVADIGFNLIQFWGWSVGMDEYGTPKGVNRALGRNMRILFESNHHGEQIYRQRAGELADHDGIFMWYVSDEPAEGAEDFVRSVNDGWHKYDKHHPTFILSCREDLFGVHSQFGDVFAFDVYGEGKKEAWSPMPQTARWMATATEATRGRKPLVCVPWANPRPETIRPIAYTALANDARGLIWYCWSQAGGGPLGIGLKNDEKCQAVLKDLVAEIKGLFPGLLSPQRRVFRAMDGKINAMACGTAEKKRFLVMTNPTDETVHASFVVPELKNAKKVFDYPTDADETEEVGKDGRYTFTFEPHAVKVLRW